MKYSDSPDWLVITSLDYDKTCRRHSAPCGNKKKAKRLVIEQSGKKILFPSIQDAEDYLGMSHGKLGQFLIKNRGEYRMASGAIVRYAA